jgi:ribose 5-phosphate isomerase B
VTPKRFGLISESDARLIEPGSTVELEPGGHVTPLARDTLNAKRVTIVRLGATDPNLPLDLAPPAVITRVAIGADHTGVALKAALISHLRRAGKAVTDHGTSGPDVVDYPDSAASVAKSVSRGEADAGIVIDGGGMGSAIAANKVRGVRAAMCLTPTLARYAREHTGTNVLTLGATLVDADQAREIVDTWLATPMREARYIRRLLKIRRLEDSF